MKIIGKEIGHTLRDFILWIMIIVCTVVNLRLVFSGSFYLNDVVAVEQAVEKVGATANAETLKKLEQLCSIELDNKEKSPKSKMYDEMSYLNTWQSMVDTYGAYLEKGEVKRFSAFEVTAIGELIYKKIFPALFFEGLLVGTYIVMRGIERGNTETARGVLYSTRCGRNIAVYRFLSSVIVVSVSFILLSSISFLTLISHYPLKHTLSAPFSAALTNSEQIVSVCALTLGVVTVIMLLTQGIGLIIRNSYGGASVAAGGILGMLFSSLTKYKLLKLNPVQLLSSSVIKDGKIRIVYHFNSLLSSSADIKTVTKVLVVYLCIGFLLFVIGKYFFNRREIR